MIKNSFSESVLILSKAHNKGDASLQRVQRLEEK